MLKEARDLQTELVETRRYLHEHPELSFQERETATFVGNRLDKLGFAVKKGLAKTGLIADFKNQDGPMVAIRADMDALPLDEVPGKPYHSRKKGVMHACGHDAHMSCALGAANLLKRHAADYKGQVRMLMQPSEEGPDEEGKSGAFRMIEDNALAGVSAIIGLHMDASLPAGKVSIVPGPVMAAVDPFVITIKGRGGHAAFPENTVDAVVIASQVVQAIQQIVSRKISALEPAVISIGSFQSSSTKDNIISDAVTLKGTIRTFSRDVRKIILEQLEQACAISRNFGGDYQIVYAHGYPTTINEPVVTQIMRQTAAQLIGEENIVSLPPKLWSEDFSMYQELTPGAFMFLGCEIEGDRRGHHTPEFDLDESGLYIGSAVLAETARRLLEHLRNR